MSSKVLPVLLSSLLIMTGLSACGPSDPEEKAYQRKNVQRSKNIFTSAYHKHSYDNYPSEPPKLVPDKPVINDNGLEIQDLEAGFGNSPEPDHIVWVHYTGYLKDGSKFDSSHDKGIPYKFTVGTGEVIAGFEQGIMGMKVGGRRRITIPPQLAYGAQGHGTKVPPNATLVYDVKLLSADH